MGFQQGDQVVYGIQGVCRIVGTECRTVDRKQVEYYVLQPCGPGQATYYVPMHNQAAVAKMRPVLTPAALETLLRGDRQGQSLWIPEENLRKETYRKLISRADCAELLDMVHCIRLHRDIQQEKGRKLHQCDENFLKDAQRLICGEISQVMGLPPDQAEAYLRDRQSV